MSQENVDTLLGGYEWFRVNGRFPAHLVTHDFVWDMSHFVGYGSYDRAEERPAHGGA